MDWCSALSLHEIKCISITICREAVCKTSAIVFIYQVWFATAMVDVHLKYDFSMQSCVQLG